jgi:hypothetical protein
MTQVRLRIPAGFPIAAAVCRAYESGMIKRATSARRRWWRSVSRNGIRCCNAIAERLLRLR